MRTQTGLATILFQVPAKLKMKRWFDKQFILKARLMQYHLLEYDTRSH